ncbi:MAG: NAD(P)H-hydrate dehydratase [Chloroflexi bacterium]|nr:NAD(P)H-hydrate dehydratase [Chloroflexota bacterium]
MGELEAKAAQRGITIPMLMENAGRAVAEELQRRFDLGQRKILVLVGPGNNGGDGLVAARYLHEMGAQVRVFTWNRRVRSDKNLQLVEERNIPVLADKDDPGLNSLRQLLDEADIGVDALLGTGAWRPIEDKLKDILTTLVQRRSDFQKKSVTLASVDVPTGLNVDTGALDPAAVPADLTITLGYPKPGLFLFPGAAAVGQLVVADIGIPPDLAEGIQTELATEQEIARLLPARPLNAHKGTFGKVLVVGGSANYTGAPYLASAAAARVGAGLVTLGIAHSLHGILAAKLEEVTFLLLPHDLGSLTPEAAKLLWERLTEYQALLLGPGLGREPGTIEFVHHFLGVDHSPTRRGIGFLGSQASEPETGQAWPPLVLDADGLNALAQAPEAAKWWTHLRAPAILTPHPGEMSRLLDTSVETIEKDRMGTALRAAERWGQVVVLKGAHTLVASPEGELTISPFANPGLASAGSGDVLAGSIAGLLAQGLLPYQAAVVGVHLHGLAGELARQELGDAGMLASDLLPLLPKAIKRIRGVR